jgi:putative membrane protein
MRQSIRLALALVAVAACHRTPAVTGGPPPAIAVSEANIVAVVLAANNTDLSYARLVPARARSSAVKVFAQRMTTDHTILNNRVNEIAQRNGIMPEENSISLDFRDHSAQRRDILRELEGAKFDSTYAANEISYHTELLDALDKVLIPNARTPELRQWLVELRPAVSAHLAHAEQVKAGLASGK